MSKQSDSPALSDDELHENLNMIGTVLASVSDRVDAQTDAMDRLVKTAAEARQAAFAARSQTDPENYGELIGKTIDGKIRETLNLIIQSVNALDQKTNQTVDVLDQAEKDKWDVINAISAREVKVERFKSQIPWLGLGAILLALTMLVLLPRFLASNDIACTVMGAKWTQTTDGARACVFYPN